MAAASPPARSFEIKALLDAQAYPHPVSQLQLIETHISWVLLTGTYAYKIKKPLDLGFLDYSTLERREQACREELRLNRRLAPQLYLDVLPVTGSAAQPRMGGDGKVLDYAVKMRQFPQHCQLDRLLASGALQEHEIDDLALHLARFHARAPHAAADSAFGQPAAIWRSVAENFATLQPLRKAELRQALQSLQAWSRVEHQRLAPLMQQRLLQGQVREGHGDLHLGNLVRLDDRILAFDGIEFNPALRWLDVISDLAFTSMDLRRHGREDLAYRLLARYLESSGDYEALPLLRYYEVYRALVRAKVAYLGRRGHTGRQRQVMDQALAAYVRLAAQRSQAAKPALLLMHGLSGSGKTWLSSFLVQRLPALRVRSDVERKRLQGLPASQRSAAAPGAGLYQPEFSQRTYARLAQAAEQIIAAGEIAIVDAAFLRRADRQAFAALAQRLGVPLAIVSCMAPVPELQRRLREREQLGGDASDADARVLAQQLVDNEPLDEAERRHALIAATAEMDEVNTLPERLQALLAG